MPKIDAGIPYFSLQTCLDEKFELIEAEFGLTGFAVIIKLYQRIYSRGYYCDWTKEVELLFSKSIGLAGGNSVSEIVGGALRRDIFDRALYNAHHILTSKGIQSRYFEAVKKRKAVEAVEEYLLVPRSSLPQNVVIKTLSSGIKPLYSGISGQSKGKESKGKKSKEKEMDVQAAEVSAPAPAFQLPLNDGSFFDVSAQDVANWTSLYPAVDVEQELRKMIGWSESNPTKRKTRRGVAAFIARWLSKEQDKGGLGRGIVSKSDPRSNPYEMYGGEII